MRVAAAPAAALRGAVSRYHGFEETTPAPMRRREGPGVHVVVLVSFGEGWVIDGRPFRSFVAGLHDRQVTTEHGGRSFGMHVDLTPPAAYSLFRVPMHMIARQGVRLEDVLDEPSLVERLHDARGWTARFRLLDDVFARRFAAAPEPSPGVVWAWRRLAETHGRVPISSLAGQLGWSRKRIVARFREEIGLPPKTVARMLRFDRACALAERSARPDWTRVAFECGYYDQSHLINDFRAVTGRTPATFFQDAAAPTP